MMKTKKVIYFLVAFLISFSANAQLPKKIVKYQMGDITIPTRWAKDVGPPNALREYPRPQLKREQWINLNGLWDYAITDKTSKNVTVFDGKILVPFPLESALSGVKRSLQPEQALWYHRIFDNPVLKAGEKLLLNFGAVSWEATVYVNGKEAGSHRGSYTSFKLDITEFLKPGQNNIYVKAWNPLEQGFGPRGKQTLNPAGMWYTPSSGIWQTVWLEKVPENYIKSIKITPDVDKGVAELTVYSVGSENVSIKVFDGKHEIASLPRNDANKEIKVAIKNIKLWSPDSPHLYDVVIKMGKDEVKSYFGMRKVEIKKDEKGVDRIFLNNQYTYNLGVLDQGFWPDGLYTAPTDEALEFDIKAIKSMGFNTIRKHIKVEPARWYYHADKIGMLIWQDLVQPSVSHGSSLSIEAKKQFEEESAEMLAQFNHFPAITTWVVFNEGWGEYDQDRLTKWVKHIDPRRLVNGHSGASIVGGKMSLEAVSDVLYRSVSSDMTDIHSYPPPAIPNHIPGKAMVLGEYGGIGVQIENHLWDDLQAMFSYGNSATPGRMRELYETMIDSLTKFEKQGLSASIYTQPYDVEGEQNGLMTYDRMITKMPFDILRKINSKLWTTSGKKKVKVKLADTGNVDFDKQLALFKRGKRDSVFLRNMTILSARKKKFEWVKAFSAAYLDRLKNPLAEPNLKFIRQFASNSNNNAFKVLKVNKEKINEILGKDEQEKILMEIIYKEGIGPRIKGMDNPDWKVIEKQLIEQYADLSNLAIEKLLQTQMLHAYNKLHDWEQVAFIAERAFNLDSKILLDANGLNTVAWAVFEHLNKVKWLNKALAWSRRSLEFDPRNVAYIDTYANILYKLGRVEEAIAWEKKAIESSPENELYKEVLRKMQNNLPTWIK